MYAKDKLQIALERYGLSPQNLGIDHRYRFVFPAIAGAGASAVAPPIRVERDCLIVALLGQASDGAAASYAGLELQFQYGGRDFASDGQTAQTIPFGVLFGNQSHPAHEFLIPIKVRQADSLYAKVVNNTAATTLTPTVVVHVVNLTGAKG